MSRIIDLLYNKTSGRLTIGGGGGGDIQDFIGATPTSSGAAGLVPAPQVGDETKFIRGDGTFAAPTVMWSVGPYAYNDYSSVAAALTDANAQATGGGLIQIDVEAGIYNETSFDLNNQYVALKGKGRGITTFYGTIAATSFLELTDITMYGNINIDPSPGTMVFRRLTIYGTIINDSTDTSGSLLFDSVEAAFQINGGSSTRLINCAGGVTLQQTAPDSTYTIEVRGGSFSSFTVNPQVGWTNPVIKLVGVDFSGAFTVNSANPNTVPQLLITNCSFTSTDAPVVSFSNLSVKLDNCSFRRRIITSDVCVFTAASCTFNVISNSQSITGNSNTFDNCTFNGECVVEGTGSPEVWFRGCVFNETFSQTRRGGTINRYTNCVFQGISTFTTGSGGSFPFPRFRNCTFDTGTDFPGVIVTYEGGATFLGCEINGGVQWQTSVDSASEMINCTLFGGNFIANLPSTADLYMVGTIFHDDGTLISNLTANVLTVRTGSNNAKFSSATMFGANVTSSVFYTSNQ